MADRMALGREKFSLGRDWDDDGTRVELPGNWPGASEEERRDLVGVVPGSCVDIDVGGVSCRRD